MQILARHPRIIAIILGALAATGFAPWSLWPVTLLCIAALMALMPRMKTRKSAFFLGWSFGLGHFTLGNSWIAHAFTYQDAMPHWLGYGAVIALALYLAVYPGLAVLGTHILRARVRRLPLTPVFAALWIITEYARATMFTGFAWNPLGVIWLDTGVEQSARVIGTYGLGALVIIAGGGMVAVVQRRWIALFPLVVLTLFATAQNDALQSPPSATRPAIDPIAITVVQPNIGQDEKYNSEREEAHFATLARLTGPSSATNPRLIFWPEAAIPAWLDMEPEWRTRIADLAGPNDLVMLGGAKVYFREKNKGFYQDRTLIGANNSAWIVGPDARLLGRYDKAHLVPYGEYLPMRALLEPIGISRLVPGDADFWAGPGPRSLPLPAANGRRALKMPPLKMGVQICYEIIFSGEVVDRKNRPDFIYNPSNDAWFGYSGPPQHLAQARLRAIEEAIPVIRSTPTGISAVVDARGGIVASIPHHKAGAINTALPAAAPATLFAAYGNLLPLGLALALLVLATAFPVVSARVRR